MVSVAQALETDYDSAGHRPRKTRAVDTTSPGHGHRNDVARRRTAYCWNGTTSGP